MEQYYGWCLIGAAILIRYILNEIELGVTKRNLAVKEELLRLAYEKEKIELGSRTEDAKHMLALNTSYLRIIKSGSVDPRMKDFAEDLARHSIGYMKIGKRIDLAELEKQVHEFHYN